MTRRDKSQRRGAAEPLQAALERELLALYDEVDGRYAGHRCPGSTECCRFAITGREPYVTSIEIAVLSRAVAARGGPLSDKRRALPLAQSRDAERTCPLLGKDQRCSVYAARPLGCRTFWCERVERDEVVRQPVINDFVRRVRAIAARHREGGENGRLLTRALLTL